MCDEVVRACRALAPRVGLAVADTLDAVADRAASTPRLVLTGPVSSGKSTLVNALVGRRVAPTGAGECTRLVAHYVRGPVDRLDVVLTDGSRRPLPLVDGGRVPAAVGDRLGIDPAYVDHLVVSLTSDALDGLTVIDTPGTGSARRGRGPEQPRADAETAAEAADAALVVLPAHAREHDLAELAGAAQRGPAGVAAVLGRADTVGAGDVLGHEAGADPDPDAPAPSVLAARRLGRRLGYRLGPVTPVIGLLAETAVTGALRTEDLHALGVLARLDPGALDLALLGVPPPAPTVYAARMARLIELLDRRGVALAVELLRTRPSAGVGEVCTALLAASGLDRLVDRVQEIRQRADLLAGAAALSRLDALVASSPGADTERVRDAVEELRTRPALADLELLEARARVRAEVVPLTSDLADELDRLAAPGSPPARLGLPDAARSELAAQAARRAAWWGSVAAWGTPPESARVAHATHRSYVVLWRELTA